MEWHSFRTWKIGEITLFYAVKANKTGLAEDLRLYKIPRNVVTNYFKEKLLKRHLEFLQAIFYK